MTRLLLVQFDGVQVVGYKTGPITYEFETEMFNYDRGIRLLANMMNVEGTGSSPKHAAKIFQKRSEYNKPTSHPDPRSPP